MDRKTYLLLSGYYAAYFAILGVWIPFWPLYLETLGFDAQKIGLLSAIGLGVKVLGPPVWGELADRGSRRRVMVLTSWVSFCAFLFYFIDTRFLWLLAVTALYSFFHSGPLALVESTTLELVKSCNADYGRIRVWGSVGFILFALAMGPLTDHWGLFWVLVAAAMLLASCAMIAMFLPRGESHGHHDAPKGGAFGLFSRPGVRGFYLSTFLMQLSHGAYYGFFSLHLEHHGFSLTWIGALWALGVLSEVVLLSHSGWLLGRLGVSLLLSGSLILAAIRWIMLGSTLWLPALLLAQTLHAFTFGSFHVAAVRRAFDISPARLRATAQGWYSALSFGVGGAVGLTFSGALYERVGGEALFLMMAVLALVGWGVSARSSTILESQ
ncbi:MAG: MFS transporter [Magnetococcales bacterium]|nr:MFS transporter [Magnetococcales bacterium]